MEHDLAPYLILVPEEKVLRTSAKGLEELVTNFGLVTILIPDAETNREIEISEYYGLIEAPRASIRHTQGRHKVYAVASKKKVLDLGYTVIQDLPYGFYSDVIYDIEEIDGMEFDMASRRKRKTINRETSQAYTNTILKMDYAATAPPVTIELRAGLVGLIGDYEEINLENEIKMEQFNEQREELQGAIEEDQSKMKRAIAGRELEKVKLIKEDLDVKQKELVKLEREMRRHVINYTKEISNFLADTILKLRKKDTDEVSRDDVLEHISAMGQMDLKMLGESLLAGKVPTERQRENITEAYQTILESQINFDLLEGVEASQSGKQSGTSSEDTTTSKIVTLENSPSTKSMGTSKTLENGNTETTSPQQS